MFYLSLTTRTKTSSDGLDEIVSRQTFCCLNSRPNHANAWMKITTIMLFIESM